MFDVFAELRAEGKTLVAVGHDLGEMVERCDRLLLLNKCPIAYGEPHDVLAAENLRQAYGNTRNFGRFSPVREFLNC